MTQTHTHTHTHTHTDWLLTRLKLDVDLPPEIKMPWASFTPWFLHIIVIATSPSFLSSSPPPPPPFPLLHVLHFFSLTFSTSSRKTCPESVHRCTSSRHKLRLDETGGGFLVDWNSRVHSFSEREHQSVLRCFITKTSYRGREQKLCPSLHLFFKACWSSG